MNRDHMSRPAQEFWSRLDEGRFEIQFDATHGKYQFYPRASSLHGTGAELSWRPASGNGRLLAWTTVRTAATGFGLEPPYLVGLVRLDEGPRVFGVLDSQAVSLAVDARVHRVAASGAAVLMFRVVL
jgi:uncharacterized OB-fold protein